MYTTHFDEILNVVCMHPDELSEVHESNEAFGDIESQVDHKANMMEIFKEFDPRARALLELAEPTSIRVWKLFDMDPPATRIAGRLCLLGDAALPFLPHIGQGAACAMEDAACLAAMLPPDTPCADVPERFRLYEECRRARAEKLHHLSRRIGDDIDLYDHAALMKRYLPLVNFQTQILSHDEYDHATQKLREYQYKKNSPRWSMPISFGPMPGPRQTFRDRRADGSSSVSWCARFKTSRTLLLNLLPRHLLSFVGPGGIAEASFSFTTFSNVSWLGGKGYNELGFYVHGVQCAQANDSALPGSFLAVVFVNSADAIANDREELGIPKVFCDLDARREQPSGYVVKASWHGTEFAAIRFHNQANGLSAADDAPRTESGGSETVEPAPLVFTHRYIPAVARNGKALADCIVCLPTTTADRGNGPERTAGAEPSAATIRWNAHSAEKLPTLHHIVQRLAELPVLEIVQASVTEGGSEQLMHEDAYVVESVQL